MFLYSLKNQEEYLDKRDKIKDLLDNASFGEELFATHRWLQESLPKRMIYWSMYGDLLCMNSKRKTVLDIGGGLSSLAGEMLKYNDYKLLDIMAHDDIERVREIELAYKSNFFINSDWSLFDTKDKYDIVISNDLFPNVDQRLELFLDKYLPICNELRMSLTYYNNDKCYKVKRIGADEIFNILAWDGIRLHRSLKKYSDKIVNYNSNIFYADNKSMFKNGRQVCVVTFKNK